MGLLDKIKKLPTLNEIQGGLGEQLTKLVAHIDIPGILILHDILIDGYSENTSQIDLLLIGEKGIYVVEVKMYSEAKIYGDGKKRQWYYYKGGNKYNICSPCLQNRNHIKYLKEFLKDFGDVPCFSVIVMICEDFKISNINENHDNPDTVVVSGLPQLRMALEALAKGKPVALSEEQKQTICDYIKEHQYEGKEKRQEHKERIKAVKEKQEADIRSNQCPYCKVPLVLRKGKYGDFYGCSNFPNCKYTQKC